MWVYVGGGEAASCRSEKRAGFFSCFFFCHAGGGVGRASGGMEMEMEDGLGDVHFADLTSKILFAFVFS